MISCLTIRSATCPLLYHSSRTSQNLNQRLFLIQPERVAETTCCNNSATIVSALQNACIKSPVSTRIPQPLVLNSLEMFPTQLLVALLSAAAFVSAASGPSGPTANCDTSTAVMDLPAGQTQLVSPTTPPLFILLAVGIQNYTCSSTTFAYP